VEIAIIHNMRQLNEAVGKSGFSVINMCDNTEIANIFHRPVPEFDSSRVN